MIEYHAHQLKIKPSVLAAIILKDSTENWVKNYAEEIYGKYFGAKKS